MSIINLKPYIPEFQKTSPENDDFLKIVEVEEEMLSRRCISSDFLTDQMSILTRDPRYLSNNLTERGWKLNLDLTDKQKRRLLDSLILINKNRGTTKVIIFTIKLLYNVDLTEQILDERTLGWWIIGVSRMGVNTRIGSNRRKGGFIRMNYDGPDLALELREDIKKVANYLRPVTIEYTFSWDLLKPEEISPYWHIGVSRMNKNTAIGA